MEVFGKKKDKNKQTMSLEAAFHCFTGSKLPFWNGLTRRLLRAFAPFARSKLLAILGAFLYLAVSQQVAKRLQNALFRGIIMFPGF